MPLLRPQVTVVIPAYNYARYLRDCVESVLCQTDVDASVVVIDDCSTDETPEVTAKLVADHAHVNVVRHESNRGHVASVNEGFSHVESEYVVKLDADDLLAPGALARATALLEAHPDVGFVYGRPTHFSGAVPKGAGRRNVSWSIWSGRDWVERRCRSANNAISQPEVVMRTALLREILPVRSELPHTSDLYQWIQLASLANVGRINGPAQGLYRVHDASMQRTVHAGDMFSLRARRAAFEAVFKGPAGRLTDAGELHDIARRSLAAEALDCVIHAYDRGHFGEDSEPEDEFVAFALEVWPDAKQLPEWSALLRRRAIGPKWAPRHPAFFLNAVRRRARADARRWRWRHTGEL
jgi:glycosyltransferase involved in cell wall biosynthesis